MNKPYEMISNDVNQEWSHKRMKIRYSVNGPGNFSCYSYYAYPHRWFKKAKTAEAIADMCNDAFEAGYLQAKRDIKNALGIKE